MPLRLAWAKLGEGIEDKGCVSTSRLRAGAGSFPHTRVFSGAGRGSSPSVPPPGSYVEIHPSGFLGFEGKSSCLLKNSILHKLGQRTRAKIKQRGDFVVLLLS